MPRFAANVSTLFTEVPFLERFERARSAGFRAVECQFPYAHDARQVKARLDDHGLEAVLINAPAGDLASGERGLGCLPGREAAFRDAIGRGVDYAATLGVPRLHCMSGMAPPGIDDAVLRRTLVANLRFAADAFEKAGLVLLLEPINAHDVPGYYLGRIAQALDLIDEVGAPNMRLQYDIYHAQRSEGELAATIERLLPRIGHMQLADNPGRHEPGTGEIQFAFLFAHIDRLGYDGWIGCEYQPLGATEAGLGWFEQAAREGHVR
ncbi:MAG: hydroxypyruvate isomerase [Caldimonas sp.]